MKKTSILISILLVAGLSACGGVKTPGAAPVDKAATDKAAAEKKAADEKAAADAAAKKAADAAALAKTKAVTFSIDAQFPSAGGMKLTGTYEVKGAKLEELANGDTDSSVVAALVSVKAAPIELTWDKAKGVFATTSEFEAKDVDPTKPITISLGLAETKIKKDFMPAVEAKYTLPMARQLIKTTVTPAEGKAPGAADILNEVTIPKASGGQIGKIWKADTTPCSLNVDSADPAKPSILGVDVDKDTGIVTIKAETLANAKLTANAKLSAVLNCTIVTKDLKATNGAPFSVTANVNMPFRLTVTEAAKK